jgi:NADPH-dependent glutamate synthase beta subunit-like oxidoreductase
VKKHFIGATYDLTQANMQNLINQLDEARTEILSLKANAEADCSILIRIEEKFEAVNTELVKTHAENLELHEGILKVAKQRGEAVNNCFELVGENVALTHALKYYADTQNQGHDGVYIHFGVEPNSGKPCVIVDDGKTARDVLQKYKKEGV